MKRLACLALVGLVLPLVGACDLMKLLQGNATTVQLANSGDYPVIVELRYSDNQYELQAVLEEFGNELTYTIAAGEAVTFFKDCEDLQAILIRKADLDLVGSVGPSASTDILRDGDDFGCGDIITYTFSHPDPPVSLAITENVIG
ncbi:MAG: hypothetical protein QUV05_15410 [Phycisphaerae bacterium]|nr:hypothetical protein [Phycisphaerae bacterium]